MTQTNKRTLIANKSHHIHSW